jgi:hypothetical protein
MHTLFTAQKLMVETDAEVATGSPAKTSTAKG